MVVRDKDLLARLSATNFPLSGAHPTLRHWLVAETALQSRQADDAIEEYRCFLYLAATTRETIAAPSVLEQCLKAHRADWRAFEDDFEENVLGTELRYEAPAQGKAYDSAYQRTLALYRETFGKEPNPNIWPSQAMRKWGAAALLAMGIGFLGAFMSIMTGAFLGGVVWFVIAVAAALWMLKRGPWSVEKSNDTGGGGNGGD
jgi:hypothetical protein